MKPATLAILLAIAAGLCWGIGEVFTRQVLHSKEIGPFAALLVRTLVALPLIALAYLAAAHSGLLTSEIPGWRVNLSTANWLRLTLGSGLLAAALALVFFYAALSLGQVSVVKPIAFAVAPVTAVFVGALMLGEPLTMRKCFAIAFIAVGIVLMAAPSKARVEARQVVDGRETEPSG
ncbi:MAG: DMT family transporter [Phycisphaera sp.]|nr:MAG: DMT family transporter [Phycisphaera sp.]